MKKILLMLAATCGLLGAVADDEPVAKVGDVEYTRFDAAMLAAIEQGEATVTILRDFTYAGQYTTNQFVGAGADTTKITIVNDYKVNFRTWDPGYGMFVDGLTLTLTGSGTWWKDTDSSYTYAGSMFLAGEKSAAANIIVESGTFYATEPKCLFNVQWGTITINGGTFKKVESNSSGTQGWCVRAEKAEKATEATGGVVIINGGTFEGPSDGKIAFIGPKSGSEDYATIRINVAGDILLKGSTAALALEKQYLVTEADGVYTSVADDYEFVRKGADGYYAAVATGTAVAKVGEVSYAEFDTALQDAIAADVATVTVLTNFTFTNTIYMVGKGTDTTKVTIENNYVVDFPYEYPRYGVFVDGLTLTLTGNGTWQKPKESASMFLAGEKSAAADIIVQSGTFYAGAASCIFNAQLGTITINGGTFQTDYSDGKCVRVEKSDNDETTGGHAIINAGTFVGPESGNTGLIIVKNDKSAKVGASVTYNLDGAIKVKGSAKAISETAAFLPMGYELTDGDSDGYYTIVKTGDTYAAVAAGSTTTCASITAASAMASMINANKTTLITVAGNLTLEGETLTTYQNLFEATLTGDGKDVTIVFTADAQATLQSVLDTAVVAGTLTEDAASFTIENATPGVYYVLYSGYEKPDDLPNVMGYIQATEADTTLALKGDLTKEEHDQAFFKLGASATAPETAE